MVSLDIIVESLQIGYRVMALNIVPVSHKGMILDSDYNRLSVMLLNKKITQEEFDMIMDRVVTEFFELSIDEQAKRDKEAYFDYRMSLPSLARYMEERGV